VNFFWSKISPLAVRFPWCFAPYHEASPVPIIVDGVAVGRVAGGEASCVSGERGMIAADGLSSDAMSVCGSSTGGLSLRFSVGNTALLDINR
jgi:hypothetical protein